MEESKKTKHMKKILLLSSFLSTFAFAQIQKVEPMFWWKGMKNPEVQILVYGKDISKYNIELSDNVKIQNLQKTENPNYVFVTINTNEVNKSSFKINIKNKNKIVDSYTYELKDRQPNSANRSSFTLVSSRCPLLSISRTERRHPFTDVPGIKYRPSTLQKSSSEPLTNKAILVVIL